MEHAGPLGLDARGAAGPVSASVAAWWAETRPCEPPRVRAEAAVLWELLFAAASAVDRGEATSRDSAEARILVERIAGLHAEAGRPASGGDSGLRVLLGG